MISAGEVAEVLALMARSAGDIIVKIEYRDQTPVVLLLENNTTELLVGQPAAMKFSATETDQPQSAAWEGCAALMFMGENTTACFQASCCVLFGGTAVQELGTTHLHATKQWHSIRETGSKAFQSYKLTMKVVPTLE